MPRRSSNRKIRSGLRGWQIGCVFVGLAPFLVVFVVGVRTCVPLQSASETRARLLDLHGDPGSFVPSPDGAVPAPRVRAFLEVRRSLQPICEQFQAMQGSLDRVEELGDRDDPTGKEIASTSRSFALVAGTITPWIGKFFEQRNRSLLEAEMGFGEYTYIFVLAYGEALRDDSAPRGVFTADGRLSPEAGSAFRSILAHQLASLDGDASPGLRSLLEQEARALARDPTRVPFPGGLPPAAAESLAPHRAQLDEVFCRATAEIDLDLYSNRALKDALY